MKLQDLVATRRIKSYFQTSIQDLYAVLPGSKKQRVTIDCDPFSVMSILDQETIDCDTLLLDTEIWAHAELDRTIDVIVNHPKLKNCTKIILTLGYCNSVIGHNTYRISWNHWYSEGVQYNTETVWNVKPANLKQNVLCVNGRDAWHRLLLGYSLHKENLLPSISFSQGSITCPLPNICEELPGIDEYTKLLPIQLDNNGRWNDHGVSHPLYSKTYANLITETEVELLPNYLPLQMVSEKSYKPFFAGQIPIIFAAAEHLSYLKHFGFDVCEELLPAEFDHMPARDKISELVNLVRKGDEFFEDYYFSNLHRLKHNFDLAKSKGPWAQTLKEIKDFF